MIPKRFSHDGFGKIFILKKIDALIGKPLIFISTLFSKKEGSSKFVFPVKRVLFVRPGGIGDAVLLLYAIKALKDVFPESEIEVLAEKRNGEIFKMVPWVKRLFLYDNPSDLIKVIFNSYDIVIDTEQWHYLSAFIVSLIRAKVKIGFATNNRKYVFDYKILYDHRDYEVTSFLNLLEPITRGVSNKVSIGQPIVDLKDVFCPISDDDPWIAISPGASIWERRWDKNNFKEIAQWLSDKNLRIVVVGGKRDKTIGDYITNFSENHLNLAGKLSLSGTAKVLSKCKFLITSDSGIMHLAIAVGTPVIALFGPGIEEKWAPRDKKSIVINRKYPCSPCTRFGYTPLCPYNVRCIKDITIEEVKEAINEILDKINSYSSLD